MTESVTKQLWERKKWRDKTEDRQTAALHIAIAAWIAAHGRPREANEYFREPNWFWWPVADVAELLSLLQIYAPCGRMLQNELGL